MQNLIARQNREKETLQTYAVQVRAPARTCTQQRDPGSANMKVDDVSSSGVCIAAA